jgi:hypothetical protein
VFDRTRLAAALAAGIRWTSGWQSSAVPIVRLSKDNRAITVQLQNAPLQVRSGDVHVCAGDSTPASARAPQNSSVSPDGKLAAYIKDYNLWRATRDERQDTQLTTDGIKDFGYATDNAGGRTAIVRCSRGRRTRSRSRRSSMTAGVRDMSLVSDERRRPKLRAWKYPMPATA